MCSRKQIVKRVALLTRHAGKDKKRTSPLSLPAPSEADVSLLTGIAAIRGTPIKDRAAALSRDWSSFLGPDLHPPAAKASTSSGKRSKKRSKTKSSVPKKRRSSSMSLPPSLSSAPQPLSASNAARTASPPLQNSLATHVSTSACTPSDLSAFLSSFAPTHDFSSTASTLHAAGLSSLDLLTSLLLAEQGTCERAVERIVEQGKLSENEGRWVSFAMGEARKEWER
jgi:hypothetical protein